MISQVSSLSLSAASAASRETDRSRYRASGSAAPGTRSNVSAAAQTSGSRHTRRPFEVPSGRFANTTSSRPALSCSINSALTPICTSSFTPGWSLAKRPSAEGSEPPATSSTPLDLRAHRRLGQVEPLRGAVETAAIGHGNEGAQQLEIQHMIDPYLRSIILENIVSIINDDLLPPASRTVKEVHHVRHGTTRNGSRLAARTGCRAQRHRRKSLPSRSPH